MISLQPQVKLTFYVLLLSLKVYAGINRPAELKVAMSDIITLSYQEDGKFKGIHYNILTQLEKISGLKFNYILYPHARLAQKLSTEAPDITILMEGSCNKFSDDYEHYGPLYEASPTIFLKKGFNSKNKNMRIGRLRGTCTDLLAENVKVENAIDLTSMKQAMTMLEADRLDGVCGLDTIVRYSLKKYSSSKYEMVVFKKQPSSSQFRAVFCTKKNLPSDIKSKLKLGLKKIKIEI